MSYPKSIQFQFSLKIIGLIYSYLTIRPTLHSYKSFKLNTFAHLYGGLVLQNFSA